MQAIREEYPFISGFAAGLYFLKRVTGGFCDICTGFCLYRQVTDDIFIKSAAI